MTIATETEATFPHRATSARGQPARRAGAPASRQRGRAAPDAGVVIFAWLVVLTAACWLVLWAQGSMGAHMHGHAITMGLSAPVFVGLWVVMMAAMMFPGAAPMFLMFTRVQRGRAHRGEQVVPAWIFVSAYLFVWSLAGVAAYAAAVGAERAAAENAWLLHNAPRAGGALLAAAGVYQFTPLKDACVSACRTPMQFVLTSWRDGRFGAWQMGIEHGVYCLGCCWLLMAILLPVGLMNVAAAGAITIVVFMEKSPAVGRYAVSIAGGALIVYGALVALMPSLLPLAQN